MRREFNAEKVFNEHLDRLLAGEELAIDAAAEEDVRTALEFARWMTALQPSPSPQFQANLKARLLQKLSEQEAREESRGWWWKLIPREPVWKAVAVLAFVIIVVGVVWGTHFRTSPSPVANVPPTTAGITAPAAPAAPITAAAPAATSTTGAAAGPAPASSAPASSAAPSFIPGQILRADASTNKTQYAASETVNIALSWQNVTSQSLTIAEFPPILSIMQSSNRQPAYTFAAGQNSITLAPGQTASYTLTWNQTDAQGRRVPPGSYYLELEEMYYQGRQVPLNLSRPVSFSILPPESSSAGNEKITAVNQSQTASGITITLQNIKISNSGFTISAFITPPADYVLLPGTPAVSSSRDYRAAAAYSIDSNLTRGAGVPVIEYFSSGMNQTWYVPGPLPPGTHDMTFVINSLGKWSGPWLFQFKIE
jgi:hypothetical protein